MIILFFSPKILHKLTLTQEYDHADTVKTHSKRTTVDSEHCTTWCETGFFWIGVECGSVVALVNPFWNKMVPAQKWHCFPHYMYVCCPTFYRSEQNCVNEVSYYCYSRSTCQWFFPTLSLVISYEADMMKTWRISPYFYVVRPPTAVILLAWMARWTRLETRWFRHRSGGNQCSGA